MVKFCQYIYIFIYITTNSGRWLSAAAHKSHKPLRAHAPRETSARVPQFCSVTKGWRVFPQAPKLFCFAVWHAVSSVSFRWFFLLSNCLVVEVGEGCRERELTWTGARVRCWVFGGDGCYVLHAGYHLYVCVCVSFLPWESLAAGVTCSNGKLCCTVQNLFWTGSPTVSSAKRVTEQALTL